MDQPPTIAARSASLGAGAGERDELVAGAEHRLGLRDHDVPVAQDRDDRRVVRQPQLVERSARRGRAGLELHLDDRDPPTLQPEQLHEVAGRDGLLHHRGQHVRRRHRRVDTPLIGEQPLVLGVVDAGQHTGHREFLLREQRRHEVVLVVAGSGDDDIGVGEIGVVQHPRLAGIAEHDGDFGDLLPQVFDGRGILFDQRDLVAAHRRDRPPRAARSRHHPSPDTFISDAPPELRAMSSSSSM